jgi:SAM-dependent methyltransferase
MTEHENIYLNETERYHALVSYEDYRQNLDSALKSIFSDSSPAILETGAGTGRVTKIIAPLCSRLAGLDISPSMLNTASQNFFENPASLMGFAAADHRWFPLKKKTFDWVVSGWSVCYLATWYADTWKAEVNRAFQEFIRVLKPHGHILLIETYGTGKTEPEPPLHLVDYLNYLTFLGFEHQAIRTDYRFPDRLTALDLVDFFFGKEMVNEIDNQEQPVLPECSGIWTISCSVLINKLPG